MAIGVELLSDYPWLLALVAVLARLARASQRGLSWPEYRVLHRLKREVFPPLDSALNGRALLVSEKGGQSISPAVRSVVEGIVNTGEYMNSS